MRRLVAVNELGKRIGEDHHNARLTDTEVENILRLHAEGWGYRRIGKVMGLSRFTVRDYCVGRRRSQVAVRWVRVSR